MRQHGAFRDTRGAPGVLQKGQIIKREIGLGQRLLRAVRQHLLKRNGFGQGKLRHHLFNFAQYEVHDGALGEAHHVADRSQDDMLNLCVINDALQHAAKVFHDDDGFGA